MIFMHIKKKTHLLTFLKGNLLELLCKSLQGAIQNFKIINKWWNDFSKYITNSNKIFQQKF